MTGEAEQTASAQERRLIPSAPLVISIVALILACAGTAAAIQANSVRSKHIVNGQVKTADLGRASVKSEKLADGAVRTAKLADGAVRGAHVVPGSVTTVKVGPGSLTGADVLDGAITTPKLTSPAAGNSEFAANTVTGPNVVDGSLGGSHFANGTIGAPALATNSVGPSQVVNSSLTGADFNESTFGPPLIRSVESRFAFSASNTNTVKQVEATCPAGKVVIGGGGQVTSTTQLVALFESWPATTTSWRAIGVYYGHPSSADPWRVEATVICASA